MYTPASFLETNPQVIEDIVTSFPLATIVAVVDGEYVVNPIPVLWRDGQLLGHIAKANDMHRLIPDDGKVVAIFRGVDSYVSPNWYPSKAETHKAVPTWNYQVVNLHGRIFFSHAEADKRRVVSLLTTRHEKALNGDAAWKMADAPSDFLAQKLADIVAFRIEIDRTEAKSKMSQNRDQADQEGVARQIGTKGWSRPKT